MARGKVGEAFVEAVAETAGFEDDLEKSLRRAVKEASHQRNWDPMAHAAALAGERAGDAFGDALAKEMQDRADTNRTRFITIFATPFQKIGQAAGDFFSQGFAGSLRGLPIAGNIARGITGALASVAELGPLGLAGLLIPLGLLIALLPLLVSAVFALGGALFSLIGVLGILPGLFFGLLATLAPLLIAFQGFGETISALASGDMEKFNEALKKLSPSARSVAKELQNLFPFFTQLRKDVQESFFSRITGSLTRLIKAVGPALSGGLQNVAFALGGFFNALALFASRPEVADFLANLFQSITDGITAGGPTLINFLSALVAAANASLPIIERLFGQLGTGLDKFSAFIQQSVADGSFQEWIESALLTLEDVFDIVGELFGLLKDMFATTDESGRTFLEDVASAVKQLREFFQSPEGKEFLENMIILAEDFGDIMIFLVGVFADLIANFALAIELTDDLAEALERLFKKKGLVGDIARFVSPLGPLAFAATGGITQGPVIAGEAGIEAILPLDDPVRARQIAADPLVANIIGGGDTTVYAIFDGEPFQARIVRTVKGETAASARRLTQKPRVNA